VTQIRKNKDKIEVFVEDKKDAIKLMDSLSCFEPNYAHTTLFKMGRWDGKKKFYTIKALPEGWFFRTSLAMQKRVEDTLDVSVDEPKVSNTEAMAFLKREIPKLPFVPYRHQLKLFLGIVTQEFHLGVSSVGSGKSLVVYLILKYFIERDKKILLLVPTIMLVSQMYQDFIDYGASEEFLEGVQQIGGEFKDKDIKKNIVISTWQSAQKSDLSSFDTVLNDECLHPESLISVENGKKEIKNLKVGDLVWTLNEETKVQELKPIIKVHKNISTEQMYEIEVGDKILRLTGNHKVYTQRGWIRTDKLTLDDDIIEIGD